MIASDAVLAWAAIGLAASLAGMIWPFRRGLLGVFVNVAVGIGGAIATALLSYAVLPSARDPESPARLLFAALGALSALGLVHAVWLRRARTAHRLAGIGALPAPPRGRPRLIHK